MRRSLLALSLLVLAAGCRPVTRIGDKIISLTDPVLVGGVVLGSAPPADPRLQSALELAGFTGFTEARLVVADALEFQDIDNALIEDAIVDATPTGSPTMAFTPDENGWFAPAGPGFLPYTPGKVLRVSAELPDRVNAGIVDVPLPDVAEVDVEPVHEPGEPLVVDLVGQGFDYAFAAVYDLDGNEVFTTAPSTNQDIVDLVNPANDPIESVTVPGETFQEDDIYIVGLAGLKRAPSENVEGLNDALTAVLAGRLELFPIVSGSPMVLNGLVVETADPPPAFATQLAALGISPGVAVELQASDLLLAGAPIVHAAVTMNGQTVTEVGEGRYRVDGAEADLRGEATVRVNAPGIEDIGGYDLLIPPAPTADLPATFPAGYDLYVPVPDGPWQAVLVTVVGPNGVTWTNVPQEAAEWSLLMRNEAEMTRVRVPAVAFPEAGAYAVGFAALESQVDTRVNLNPRFSHVLTGTLAFQSIVITDGF
ncbi:MAG: hypothetical protein KC656_07125 [Myxococcales bacterium]|nr:hypothetical protein [Myxococcales bacterium]MCB9670104.1 hypothetical protein [Alphaproteobacteria bacterium]